MTASRRSSHTPAPSDPGTLPEDGRRRVVIEAVYPAIDAGAYAIKRTPGERVELEVDLIADGHDELGGAILYRPEGDGSWREAPLEFVVNDRYRGAFVVDREGPWLYTIEAWVDAFATYRRGLARKLEAGAVDPVDLLVGAELVAAAHGRAGGADRDLLASYRAELADEAAPAEDRAEIALRPELAHAAARHPDRRLASRYPRELPIFVDRPRARMSAWYELFPRSWGPPGHHATLRHVEDRLPYVADMGFDIVYFPPIHPIGVTHRKGPNNRLDSLPGDPGSPWAIGAAEGGHKAIHPELGTLDDFRRLRRRAEELGLEVALDVAFQASPDHPYVREHPEWFLRRPDGTIQYAENPPKKYQDVYPFHFECDDWPNLWRELLSIFQFWIDQGVKVFRVDNPHTKPLAFWRWCLAELKARHPEVIFLSEAFTRPKLMYALAKLGFTQSYTYFTWRETSHELRAYLEELTSPPVVDIFRPNFWPNTPDILPEHLQGGGRPMFVARLALAATLAANYGIYGPAFELMERTPRPGSGEYINNEKYQIRSWNLDDPESLRPVIARINHIRRENPALHDVRSLRFHDTDNETLLCYSKRAPEEGNTILVVVNLDPHHTQSGWTRLELPALGLEPDQPFDVHDLLGEAHYRWQGPHNYVELNPHVLPAHIFRVETPSTREPA